MELFAMMFVCNDKRKGGDAMPTECERIKDLLSAYMDGACTAEERAAVEAHLQNCTDCTEYLHTVTANTKWVAETAVHVPEALHASVMAAVAAEKKGAFRKQHHIRVIASGLAACLAVAVLAGAAWRYLVPMLWPQNEALGISNMSYTAEDAAVYLLYLSPDGTWTTSFVADAPQATLTLQSGRAVLSEDGKTWQGSVAYAADGTPQTLIFDQKTYRITFDTTGNMTVRAED